MKKNLKNLLENLLHEDIPTPVPNNMTDFNPPETPLNVSVDQAIDRYIIRYEKESIPTISTYENQMADTIAEDKLKKLLEKILNEAPEEAPEAEKTEVQPTEAPSNEDSGEQPIISTPQINLQDFTRSIARLVNNYDALLNIKEIILNRVKEYIKINYDVRTAQELTELLTNNYNLSTLDDINDKTDSLPTPYAQGALSREG